MQKIEKAWKEKNVVWVSGVRRAGKTFLAKSLPRIQYFDCELPRVRRMMDDPESFLEDLSGQRIVLDEIHRLENPSQILKIAADHYPKTKILATGSSTLGASAKFKDTLTGRKVEIWLTPMILADLSNFGNQNLKRRFLRGGLPPFFLAQKFPEKDFQEWMDAYWAKDIQELFRLERRHSFLKFAELLFARSGGIFEAVKFSTPCEVSRTTITNYLAVLEATFVVHVIRPFSARKTSEIVSAPKIYTFDTGFTAYYRGWVELRAEDLGFMWEHFVLNELQANLQSRQIFYWRDKRGHEVDFILVSRNKPPAVIECKSTDSAFNPDGLLAFRSHYPEGENFVTAQNIDLPYSKNYKGVQVHFLSLTELIKRCSLFH